MMNNPKQTVIQPLRWLFVLLMFVSGCTKNNQNDLNIVLAPGIIVGEVTWTSAILQARLAQSDTLIDNDLPGASGTGYFELSTSQDFQSVLKSEWLPALPEHDFILKTRILSLTPNTRYFVRLRYGKTKNILKTSYSGQFKTLQTPEQAEPVSLVAVTGINYARHFYGRHDGIRKSWEGYQGPDRDLGFPALKTMLDLKPDFFVGTGDNVYYDRNSPGQKTAETRAELRQRWHEQFAQPRFREFFAHIPTYWEKDDHDHRYNDSDTLDNGKLPGHRLGCEIFREQVPVVSSRAIDAKTYRTYRMNKHLQLWFTEGRDYRSPNAMPDGPEKTMWGLEQRAWLKRTLLESEATFKILISPTSLVGPDDWGEKCDNHLNCYRYERQDFFDWLVENEFPQKNLFVICGDRHWQYHAVDPTGIHEFGTGALVDGNARLGVKSGAANSTDPKGLIQQPYLQPEPSGGFLWVEIREEPEAVVTEFKYYDENGVELYCYRSQTEPR